MEALFASQAEEDIVVRGLYDVSGLRADADLMVWWHAEDSEMLQSAYNTFRRTTFGARLDPSGRRWRCTAPPSSTSRTSRPSWPTRSRRAYICVYPFVRSYEWYLLDDGERRAMLAEHGKMARDYPDVRANTVASFALGDYEWMLAFEADELYRIVDLMRHLRGSGDAPPRPRRGAVLHRLPGHAVRADRPPSLSRRNHRCAPIVVPP